MKLEFKIFQDDSKLESLTRPASLHNAEIQILRFDNVKWT